MSTDAVEDDDDILEFAEMETPNVTFADVAGLQDAKNLLKEAIILPLKFPHLFTGNRMPQNHVLLFGAPGTGKTLLLRAAIAAMENEAKLLRISCSCLISRYGKLSGEELVRKLFEKARRNKPCVLLLDDLDVLCQDDSESDGCAMRRTKCEFLVQLYQGDNASMHVLGATSRPWDLNAQMRRSFEKRIYIPLPEAAARSHMFSLALGKTPHMITDQNLKELGQRTDGYSGADVTIMVRDALMQPVRKVQTATHFRRVRGLSPMDKETIVDDLLEPCSPGAPGAIEMSWTDVPGDKLSVQPVTMDDLIESLQRSKRSVTEEEAAKFDEFNKDFGYLS